MIQNFSLENNQNEEEQEVELELHEVIESTAKGKTMMTKRFFFLKSITRTCT